MLTADSLRVVLVRARNPLNIGAVARAMSNFGFQRLRVVNPYEVAFREARSAIGASQVLANAQEFQDVGAAIADCSLVVGTTAGGHRDLQHAFKRLEAGGDVIRSHPGPVALLFGSEKVGLSNDALSYCHWLLHVPTTDQNLSMNVGQAVAVCLYELIREVNPILEPLVQPASVATAENLDRLTGVLTEALYESGYMKADALPAVTEKTRRLIRRMHCVPATRKSCWECFANSRMLGDKRVKEQRSNACGRSHRRRHACLSRVLGL